MAALIYALCALTSCTCAVLLFRSYSRSRYKLLLWAGYCFMWVTLNNLLLIVDKVLFPNLDLLTCRLVVALAAVVFLLYGLIFDE